MTETINLIWKWYRGEIPDDAEFLRQLRQTLEEWRNKHYTKAQPAQVC